MGGIIFILNVTHGLMMSNTAIPSWLNAALIIPSLAWDRGKERATNEALLTNASQAISTGM